MKLVLEKLCTIFLAMLFATPALAQDCDAILRGGVFNESVRDSKYESRDVVMRFACNSKTVNTGGGATAVVYGVPMSGNAYQDKVQESCDSYNSDRFVSKADFEFVREASAVLADAWSNCMNGGGTSIGLKQSPDIKEFLLTVNYRQAGPNSPKRTRATLSRTGGDAQCKCVKSVGGGNCNVRGDDISLIVPSSGTVSLTCTRTSVEGILFALQSSADGQQTASLPSLRLDPAAIITPSGRIFSGGKCDYNTSPIPNFQVQVTLHDFENLPPMSLSYRGNSSSVGVMTIDPNQPFALANVTMLADRKDNKSGLYLTIGDQTKFILKQGGNYDCDYDRGRGKINNLRVDTKIYKLF
jgi:hypothetical protein